MRRELLTLAGDRRPAPREFALGAADVDLWCADLDAATDGFVVQVAAMLSADEVARAAKFFFARDRRRFMVGRGLLRALLARYTDLAPAALRFGYGAHGKPALVRPPAPMVHFNLSHGEHLAVYAFATAGAVGIDVERIRDLPDWEAIAQTCFDAAALGRLKAAPAQRRRAEFFRAWTRQEAALKASGEGLGGVGPLASSRCAAPTGFAAIRPQVFPLGVGEEFAAAVAVPPTVRWAHCHLWDWSVAPTLQPDAHTFNLEDPAESRVEFL